MRAVIGGPRVPKGKGEGDVDRKGVASAKREVKCASSISCEGERDVSLRREGVGVFLFRRPGAGDGGVGLTSFSSPVR